MSDYDTAVTQAVSRATINASAGGNTTLVAAVAGRKIRVYNVMMIAAGAAVVHVQSGAGGTSLSGPLTLAANTGFAPGPEPYGHWETAAGALLNLNLSTGVVVGGWLIYAVV